MYDNSLEPVTSASWPAPPGGHELLRGADGLLVAALHGEIDLANVHQLRTWLDSIVALRAPAYVVDLRAVPFIDSIGLNTLLRLRHRVREHGARFAVLCAPGTRRLLRAHGTLDTLNAAVTWDEATA